MSYKLLKVNPYSEYKLRLTMQGVITLEDTFKKGIYEIIGDLASGKTTFDFLLQILKQALMPYDYVKCDNDVYTIYDDLIDEGYTMADMYNLILLIFTHAGFFNNNGSEENEKENKTKNNTYPEEEGENPDPKDKCFIYSIRDRAMECGMPEKEFWNSTFGEVVRYIKAYNDNYINEKKNELKLAHFNADLICYSVARLLSKEAEFPDVLDMYPKLFEEELQQREVLRKIQQEEAVKENIIKLWKQCVPKEKKEENITEGEMDNGEQRRDTDSGQS